MVLHVEEAVEINIMKSICDLEERQSGSDRERGFRREDAEVRKCFYLKK